MKKAQQSRNAPDSMSPQDPIIELHGAQKRYTVLQNDVQGFEDLAQLLKDATGINLKGNDKNHSLMASRLSMLLQEKGLSSYREYLQLIRTGGKEVMTEFISALTTNTTSFFRENEHFEVLKKELPPILEQKRKAGQTELRVWCAASSTGQEPYTIAIVLMELLGFQSPWSVKFLASDIDDEALERAARGVYSESEMSSLPPMYKQKYFDRVVGAADHYRVKPDLRALIRFANLNLSSAKYPFQHRFDVIFCRNVLIYFELSEASQVVERMTESLAGGGLLFLGHSEAGTMRTRSMASIGPATFRKSGKAGSR